MNGLYEKRIAFTLDDLNDAVELSANCQANQISKTAANMKRLSFLQIEKYGTSQGLLGYQFLHLTFQEFFAAQWLSNCFDKNKRLGLEKARTITAEIFIQQHKYNPQYKIVWWFTAGLLQGKEDSLKRFFETLGQGSQDLIGIQHQHLLMNCIKEVPGQLPEQYQKEWEMNLDAWLTVELELKRNKLNYNFKESLGRQAAFSEILLLKRLEIRYINYLAKTDIIRTLGYRTVLSERAFQCLITLLKDPYKELRSAAARALGQQSNSPLEILKALMNRLTDLEENVRLAAARALGQQSNLPLEILKSLIDRFKDRKEDVRSAVAKAVGGQPNLPLEVLKSLMEHLKDKRWRVRFTAASALGYQSNLSLEILKSLRDPFKNLQESVRFAADKAFG